MSRGLTAQVSSLKGVGGRTVVGTGCTLKQRAPWMDRYAPPLWVRKTEGGLAWTLQVFVCSWVYGVLLFFRLELCNPAAEELK